MPGLTVARYSAEQKPHWEAALATARNGLFIFHRQKVVETVMPPENVPKGVN